MPNLPWTNLGAAGPGGVVITAANQETSTTSSITVTIQTNITSTVTASTNPPSTNEGPTAPSTIHSLTFTGLASSTTYAVTAVATSQADPSDTTNISFNAATVGASGNFSIASDLTIIDPLGNAFLPVGANVAAGGHTAAGYFTSGSGGNINNNNFSQVGLDGFTTTGPNPTAFGHMQALKTYWPGWNVFRLNVAPGDGLPNWGSDPELRRVIKALTDNRIVAMVENHGSTTTDPTASQISAAVPQWEAIAQWGAANLTNPEYLWCNPWNEPGGSAANNSVYSTNNNSGNVTHDDAWIDWHVPCIDAFRTHLPDNMCVLDDSKAGQAINHGQATWRSESSCLATWMPDLLDGSAPGAPPGGYQNLVGAIHMYQRWGGSNPPVTWPTEGVTLVNDAAADLKSKGVSWHCGEIGGNTEESSNLLQNDEYGGRAFFQAKPDGVGCIWWAHSVNWATGYSVHGPVNPDPPSRIPMWHFNKKNLTIAEHNTQTSLFKLGEIFWDWTRTPPPPTP